MELISTLSNKGGPWITAMQLNIVSAIQQIFPGCSLSANATISIVHSFLQTALPGQCFYPKFINEEMEA